MKQSEYIAAIDLGTSKMIAMVGRKNDQGIISIISAEKESSDNCIRRACVYNVEETANKINNLLFQLNQKLNPKINKIYVGLGGQSLRTEIYSVKKEIPNTIVTDKIINSLKEECKQYEPELAEVLDIVSPEYFLDGRQEMNPVGVQCSNIEARFKLILGRPSLKRTLTKSIQEKANTEIADFIIAPIATATAVLTDTEKELGCALIEFGAGVTYLSIYKNNLLKYLIALPLGGNVITKDISSLNILEKEAEDLKIRFGSALIEIDNDTRIETAKMAEGLYGSKEIELSKLNNVIEARVDEIIANIIHQINESGFANALGAGIIITGGGAALRNLPEAIKIKSGYDVRIASVKKTLVNQAAELSQEYGNSEVIGLLALGKYNCAKLIEETPKPMESLFDEKEIEVVKPAPKSKQEKPKSGGLFSKFARKMDGFSKNLFEEDKEEDQ